MKRIINLCLLLSFQFCYLEWPNNSIYIYQAEIDIFSKTESLIDNLSHPIILLGLIPQIIILLSVFIGSFNKKINTIAVLLLSLLVLFFFLIGLLALNYKIAVSTIPFLIFVGIYFYRFRK